MPRRTRLATMSPISEDAQKEGRCQESMVHRVHKGLPLRAGEGTQGWLAHPGGGSSLPDWLTFQCHSRSRGASPLLLVTGVMLACCLSTARQSPAAVTAKLWGLGAAPPYPHASKLDSTCSSGPILNSSCSENLGAEILSSPLAVLPPPHPSCVHIP